MQSYEYSFIVIGEEGRLDFDRQILTLILIHRQLVDDFSHNIMASMHKVFIDFKAIVGLSEYFVPFLTIEAFSRVNICLRTLSNYWLAHVLTATCTHNLL